MASLSTFTLINVLLAIFLKLMEGGVIGQAGPRATLLVVEGFRSEIGHAREQCLVENYVKAILQMRKIAIPNLA